LANAPAHPHFGGCVDAFYFLLAFAIGLPSNERPKRVATERKKCRHVITIFSLIGAVAFELLLGGCADVYYVNKGIRSPEARYDTYYAPDYYPYYPWDGYYGGAYYSGE
jgi:hypothetical protein